MRKGTTAAAPLIAAALFMWRAAPALAQTGGAPARAPAPAQPAPTRDRPAPDAGKREPANETTPAAPAPAPAPPATPPPAPAAPPSGAAAPKAPQQAPEAAQPAPGTADLPPLNEPTEESEPGSPSVPPGTATAGTGLGGIGLFPQAQAPAATTAPKELKPEDEDAVLAEDWWSHARPVFEIHGYFRTRAELFHNFSLGRIDSPSSSIWPRPLDDAYPGVGPTGQQQDYGPELCTADERGEGDDDSPHNLVPCSNNTHAGANLRFRLDPELHVSDNLRVVTQVDLLDNAVLGSTPSSYAFRPGDGGGYELVARPGDANNGVFDDDISAPSSGVNSLDDSVRVKRAWGEYTTPVGELRFGRMPDHFGLGMLHNSGDGYDDDYQSTIDRLQFISAIKPLDLYLGGSWDFPNEGPISGSSRAGGQPYDLAQLDDVNQWTLLLMRRQSEELVKNTLSKGGLVLDAGAYVTLRKQLLANDKPPGAGANEGANVPDATLDQLADEDAYTRRDAVIWIPDLWFRLRYKKFRFEAEFATVLGSIANTDNTGGTTTAWNDELERKIREFGLATQIEQRLVEDRLKLAFDFGWASGDPDAFNPESTNNLAAGPNQVQINDDTISTFRFHPSYRVDLILHRNLLQRVQGTYYFKPSVEYDFMRKVSGQRLGGGAAIVWSRASEFVQTPGHATDLGVELDGRLYFQSKDGATNDRAEKMGGFYSMLEYGVLFPMSGLDYMPRSGNDQVVLPDTSAAQILRLYLGVLF